MPIGKRKGVSAKGVGATPGGSGTNKIGGSLSKNDYNYIERAFGIAEYVTSLAGNPTGHVATGGVIKDFIDGDTVRRSHTFLGDGTFTISSLSPTFPATVDFLLVGGGAGGGSRHGGGGGAGGLISSDPGVPSPRRAAAYPVSASSYAITIGQGGAGGQGPSAVTSGGITSGMPGTPSTGFGYIAEGGGSGTGYPSSPMAGWAGGSGGGGAHPGGSYGDGNKVVNSGTNAAFTTQGYDGGAANPGGDHQTGGGGGAGGAGGTANASASGAGGAGLTMEKICPGDIPVANRTFAAGGGGGGITGGAGGSSGIGGAGGPDGDSNGGDAINHTGSGGGGARTPANADGGAGSPGICIVSYEIGLSNVTTNVASGGDISYYAPGSKVIHTFLSSGTFTLPAGVGAKTCQILVVGGGGGGGNRHGGGGGGGGVLHLPTGTVNPGTYSVLVGGGGIADNGYVIANAGTQSSFGPPTSAATPSHLIAKGGGWGGSYPGESGPGGGCGGGGCGQSGCSGGAGDQPNPSAFGTSFGYAYAGGAGNNGNWPDTPDGRLGGGGGGAGGQGNNAGGHPFGPSSGKGGVGKQIQIAGDPANNHYWAGGGGGGAWGQAGGTPNGGHPNLFAGDGGLGGGGGGSSSQESPNPGYSPWMPARPNCAGLGGGSALATGGDGTQSGQDITGANSNRGGQGGQGTGGGGGGNGQGNYSHWPANLCNGGQGGSGIVIIAYPYT